MSKNRTSIQPTYDSRETGLRFNVSTWLHNKPLNIGTPIADPFVHTTVRVGVWDVLRSLLRFGHIEVRVIVVGDQEIIEDILELDANYIGNGTRRAEWNKQVEQSLADFRQALKML